MAAPTSLTPEQRSLRARVAVHTSWKNTSDRRARTVKASEAFLRRFEDEVDPDRTLTEHERRQRADSARKAYFARLAYKSARARAARKGAAR